MVALTKNEEFSNRLNRLLDTAGAPQVNQGRARWFHDFINKKLKINVTYESTRKWLSGDSIPYTKRLGTIARGLNSTTEYLIGEADDADIKNYDYKNRHLVKNMEVNEPGFFDITEYEYGLIQLYRQLPKAQQEFIRVSISGLISQHQQNKTSQA